MSTGHAAGSAGAAHRPAVSVRARRDAQRDSAPTVLIPRECGSVECPQLPLIGRADERSRCFAGGPRKRVANGHHEMLGGLANDRRGT